VVRSLPRSIAFYRDSLGLPLLFEAPPKLAFFRCNSVRLMLSEGEKQSSNSPSTTVIYFKAAPLQKIHSELLQRGATFEEPPHLVAQMPDHELWMAFFRDPDGHPFGLMEEVRP